MPASPLPQTSRPDFPPFTFPNVALPTAADPLPFASFPERIGWSVKASVSRCWIPPRGTLPTQAELVAFLQSWLFFGAITELSQVFDLHLDIDAELRVTGSDWLSTAPLGTLRERCSRAHEFLGPADAQQRCRRVSECRAIFNTELEKKGPDPSTHCSDRELDVPEEHSRVYTALDILLRVLALLEPPSNLPGVADLKLYVLSLEVLPRMGWCPSEVEMLTQNIYPQVLFLASTLERPLMFRSHKGCDRQRCLADQVVEETYETVHVKPECQCNSIAVPGEELSAVLEQGRIPKISFETSNGGDQVLGLKVVEDLPYLAISHVWAHGLGNPHENSLPRCQLVRIRSYIENLRVMHSFSKPLALWIDTLCIPVQPTLRRFRNKAIQLLAKTYRNATFVLVLDRELQIESCRKSLLELSIRVLCSGWLRRLWTLQEASLVPGNKIHFQMHESHPLAYDELMSCLPAVASVTAAEKEAASIRLYNLVSAQIYRRIPPIRFLQEGKTTPSQQLDSKLVYMISGAVQYRSTSKVEDEPVCMASLLGMPLEEILKLKTAHERMAKFHTLIRQIPAEIIFSPTPKLLQRPFRWAPSSMVNSNFRFHQLDHKGNNVGICDGLGFHVQFDGAVLSSPNLGGSSITVHGPCIVIDTATGREYVLNSHRVFPPFVLPSDKKTIEIPPKAALIFQEPVKPLMRDGQVLVVAIEEAVMKDRAEAGTNSVEYIVTIIDHGFFSQWSEWAPWGVRNSDPEKGRPGLSFSGTLKVAQAWCVT